MDDQTMASCTWITRKICVDRWLSVLDRDMDAIGFILRPLENFYSPVVQMVAAAGWA
jgi:hypothetical protein